MDADLTVEGNFDRKYLELVVVRWDKATWQYVLVANKRRPIWTGEQADFWSPYFYFRHGAPPRSRAETETPPQGTDGPRSSQPWPNEGGQEQRIGRWRQEVAVSSDAPTKSYQCGAVDDAARPASQAKSVNSEEKESLLLIPVPELSRTICSESSNNPVLLHLMDIVPSLEESGKAATIQPLSPSIITVAVQPRLNVDLPSPSGDVTSSSSDATNTPMSLSSTEAQNQAVIAFGPEDAMEGTVIAEPRERAASDRSKLFDLGTAATTGLLKILEGARMSYLSTVSLEAKIGKLFVRRSSIPEAWRPKDYRPAKVFHPGDWHKFYTTPSRSSGPATTVFSSRLTDSQDDAAYLASLVETNSAFSPYQSTSFRILCRNKQSQQKLIFAVEEGKHIQFENPSQKIGEVNIHNPVGAWDTSVTVTTSSLVQGQDLAPFQTTADSLWARGRENHDMLAMPVIGAELDRSVAVESAHLTRSMKFTVYSDSKPLVVHVTQVQRLQVETTHGSFRGFLGDEKAARLEGRIWYEVSVRSQYIDNFFSLNEHLQIGDIADYGDLEGFQNECARMVELSTRLLANMDDVGLNSIFHATGSASERVSNVERSNRSRSKAD